MHTNKSMSSSSIWLFKSAMRQTGVSSEIYGQWRVSQLGIELQQTLYSYPENFQGQMPKPPNV